MEKVSNPSKMEINSTLERGSGKDGECSRLTERREGDGTPLSLNRRADEHRKREDSALHVIKSLAFVQRFEGES